MESGRVYESAFHHNVVFVGMDEKDNPKYAALRGIGTSFIGEANGSDLNELMEEFEKAKENARDTLDYRKTKITLNEWFEEWFSEVKQHRVKETSIAPMKNNFKRTFGFYIGSMKLKDIKPLDVQRALNAMEQNHVSHSAMREALGRLRECLDFALGNQPID